MSELYDRDDLKELIKFLPAKDHAFANDLLVKPSTPNRDHWVAVLCQRAIELQEHQQQKQDQKVGDFSGVYALFQKAAQHLKYPRIRLQTPDGLPVHLYVSGSGSKEPGVVNVTDGRPYGENKWYGRVKTNGVWESGMKKFPEHGAVRGLLTKLAEKPAETAAEYGRLTGHCCFCGSVLTDDRSTAVGYGPTCAKNFGLAWGEKKTNLEDMVTA